MQDDEEKDAALDALALWQRLHRRHGWSVEEWRESNILLDVNKNGERLAGWRVSSQSAL